MPSARRIVPIFLIGAAAACSSGPPPQREPDKKDAERDREIQSLRAQVDEQTRARAASDAAVEDLKRDLAREGRELAAVRETSAKRDEVARLSETTLKQVVSQYEKQIKDWKVRALTAEAKNDPVARGGAVAPESSGVASAPGKHHLDLDAPVAIVDGEPVARRELAEWLFYNFVHKAIDGFVNIVLVEHEARRLGIAVSDDEVEATARTQLAAVSNEAGGDDKFRTALEKEGVTYEDLLEVLRMNGRALALATKLCFLARKTPEGEKRIEAKLRDAYWKSSSAPHARVKHLYIPVRPGTPEEEWTTTCDVVKKLRAQIEAGEEPSAVAANAEKNMQRRVVYDPKPWTKLTGAQFPELDRAVFEGPVKKFSDPIRSRLGVSMIFVEDRSAATATFEESRALLYEDLVKPDKLSPEEPDQLYQDLRAKAKIEKRVELK